MSGSIVALSRSAAHAFSKDAEPRLTLIKGLGIEGDAHAGVDLLALPTGTRLRLGQTAVLELTVTRGRIRVRS